MTNLRVAYFFALFIMFGSVLLGSYHYYDVQAKKLKAERSAQVTTPNP